MSGFMIGHYPLEAFLFGIALMMLLSIISSKASAWIGVPGLLLFLGVGMLAGSEGPGGIEFTNYSLAYVIGSISLIFILFDGGMGTNWGKVRPVLGTGLALSTLGVVFTCVLIGVFCHYVFWMDWPEALLLGAIVSSTDAAAVFSILRSKSLELKGTLKSVLELEAGSNDPMAIFLTTVLLQFATQQQVGAGSVVLALLLQALLGGALGYLGGRATVWIFNSMRVDYDGLYHVLLISLVLLVFSVTALVGGSGFLAVYVAGLVIGNSNVLRKQSICIFQDGLAWMAQISLFVVLGLLVFPSHLTQVWREGIMLALFMMFVARPVSVLLAAPLGLRGWAPRLFVSWVGLRGAAPIILAILPWASAFPRAEYLFNLVFFVVLFSVFFQAPTISWLAGRLGIVEAAAAVTPKDQTFLPQGFVTMNLIVGAESLAVGKRTVDLALPAGVLLISLERSQRFSVPRGETVFEPLDRIVALGRPSNQDELKRIFGN